MPRKNKIEYIPYSNNDDIHVFYELEFLKDVIKPGDKIKFKNTRGNFIFLHMAHNSKIDVTWIDCRSVETGEYRSFYIERLKGLIREKRSRRKKQLVRN